MIESFYLQIGIMKNEVFIKFIWVIQSINMACRTYNNNDFCGLSFVGTLLLIFGLSFIFAYEFLNQLPSGLKTVLITIFILIFAMVIWSLLATAFTEPGRVPFYWGMSHQNNRSEQRKYCLHCHNFKPQRSHHCSACKKCVLNMDHHCPWVNNCIGFHNRKMFILFIFYLEIGLIFMGITCIIVMIGQFKKVADTAVTDIHFALKLICTLVVLPLAFTIGAFFLFHFNMVLDNTTTLQNMIRKRQLMSEKAEDTNKGYEQIADYDIGKMQNFMQVFGENGFHWLIPIEGDGPKGTGTYWLKNSDLDNLQHTETARGLRSPKY